LGARHGGNVARGQQFFEAPSSFDLAERAFSGRRMSASPTDAHAEPKPGIPPVKSRKVQSVINLISLYFSVILSITQGIILTPLYLKYIPPSLYGAWLASGNILTWIAMVDPGISRILQQRTAYTFGRGELDKVGGVIGTGLLLGTFFAMLPLLAIPFSDSIAGQFKLVPSEHAELTTAFNWALISTSVMIAMFQPSAANLGLQQSVGAGVAYSAATLTGIVVTYCMLRAGYGLLSIPMGLTVRAIIMLALNAAWMIQWCRKNLRGKVAIHKEELRKYSTLSAFTFFERLISGLLTQSDVFITARVVSNEVAVLYSLTGRGFEPVRMAADRLLPAFLPGLAHLAGEGNRERLQEICRRLMSVTAFAISVGAGCVVAMNFAFVKLWVGDINFGGERLTLLFAMLTICNVLFNALAETTFAVGGVGPIEVMRMVEGIVRIILQLVLLKYLGVIGIPLGGCIGMFLVSGTVLPGLSARKLGIDRRTQYRIVAANFLRAGVLMLCGAVVWYVLSGAGIQWTWVKFFGWGALVGILFSAIGLAMSPSTRYECQLFLKRLRRPKATA
jgi:O-antigen/teichoic acid export membrane protein